jgi:hypothetical protein
MNNLILISLPKIETTFPPAALAILASIAKENNFTPIIFDFNLKLFKELAEEEWNVVEAWCEFTGELPVELNDKIKTIFINHLKTLITADTKFVCFSALSYYSNRITELALRWYNEVFDITTILGGPALSSDTNINNKEIFGEYLLKLDIADYIVFGEGELTFDSLLKDSADYPGINKNNPVQIEDISDLPMPTYEFFDIDSYFQKRVLITGSRGCVRKCTFCDVELSWPKFRFRKAESIVAEIKKHFYEHGTTEFEFTDSLINGSITNFNRFNELLYDEKQKDPALEPINYRGQFICRDNSTNSNVSYELMHLAGCSTITTGIESFSNNVRKHMKKKFSNDAIEHHFKQCAKWGIPNVVLMIIGYPTETLADHQDNLDALHKYKIYSDMGTIFMMRWGYTMHLYENTPIMSMADELQLNFESNIRMDSLFGWTSGLNPSNTLLERIRRRLEIHETSYALGYSMPRVGEELSRLKKLAEICLSQQPTSKKIFPITQSA